VYSCIYVAALSVSFDTSPNNNHEVSWNAHDDSGRSVSAGVYFGKLETNRGSMVQRVTITR